MTARELTNKIADLEYWVDNNPNHPDHQQKLNLLMHYQYQLSKKQKLTS